MQDGQSSVMTLDLELTKLPPEHTPSEDVQSTSESSDAREAISHGAARVTVDSFGKAILAAASFYEQKNIATRIEEAINSPEVMAIVVLNVSRVSSKDQHEPARETVHIQSTVHSHSKLSARGLLIRFRNHWLNTAAWLTALLLTLSGLLIFGGLQAELDVLAISGAIVLAALTGVWGIALTAWALLMIVELISLAWSGVRGSK